MRSGRWIQTIAVLALAVSIAGSWAYPARGEGSPQPVYATGKPNPDAVEPSARLALVIGNNAYPKLRELNNAVRDATNVANALKNKGFTLIGEGGTVQIDRNLGQMRALLDALVQAAVEKPGSLVVIYFSGHGTVVGNRNLLMPVDMDGPGAIAEKQQIAVADMAERLHRARVALTVLFIDSCRDSNRSDNERYVPEQLPDNTFVGFSTRFGGMASDENDAEYSATLVAGLQHGFDTLVTLHLSLLEAAARQFSAGRNGVIQLPVFSIGRYMPARPVSFYPTIPMKQPNQATRPNLEVSLAQSCDELSYGLVVEMEHFFDQGPPLKFVAPCKAAFAAGWRSREVLRGYGMSLQYEEIRIHRGNYAGFGYLFQAAELGDASALEFLLFSAMLGGGGDGVLKAYSDPNGYSSEQGVLNLENYLVRAGLNITGINVNSIPMVMNYGLLRLLRSDDKNISFWWANVIQVGPEHKFGFNGHYPYDDPSHVIEAQRTMARLAESGHVPTVAMLMTATGQWTKALPVRRYMLRVIASPNYGKPIKVNPNLLSRPSFAEINRYTGSIGFFLLRDLMNGNFGPRDPVAAVNAAMEIEAKLPYFTTFDARVQLIECYEYGVLLINGRTQTGVVVPQDIPRGLRLVRYAADHGLSTARETLNKAGIR